MYSEVLYLLALIALAFCLIMLARSFIGMLLEPQPPETPQHTRTETRQLNHDTEYHTSIQDPHCPAAVCTPSRHGMITNAYYVSHQAELQAQYEIDANIHRTWELTPTAQTQYDARSYDEQQHDQRSQEYAALGSGSYSNTRAELPAGDDYIDTTWREAGDRQEVR